MTKCAKTSGTWSANLCLRYDAWNRLVVVLDQDDTTVVATYQYNGLNRRVKKVVGSETRLFYFNREWQCIEEYVGSTCDARYVWGLRYIDDLVTYRKGSTDYYVLQDANWNVVALTNTAGVVQERYAYSPFGGLEIYTAAFATRSTSTCNVTRTFTGQVLDAETGLMLYRNRMYHPRMGRFVQRDPIGYSAGDVNLVRYVGNRTTFFSDSMGLWGNSIYDVEFQFDEVISNPTPAPLPSSTYAFCPAGYSVRYITPLNSSVVSTHTILSQTGTVSGHIDGWFANTYVIYSGEFFLKRSIIKTTRHYNCYRSQTVFNPQACRFETYIDEYYQDQEIIYKWGPMFYAFTGSIYPLASDEDEINPITVGGKLVIDIVIELIGKK